ncbi:MAG: LysR substrate-binding domain-containing protein [Pseudomonadota bacterium]
MNRRLLPLNALRAFEVSARRRNLSRAAEELGVTHSAISQQIRQLEALLGVKLFHRTGRGVDLTEAGHTLLPILADSFDRMGETLDGLLRAPERDAIAVTTTPSFATKWLMPRLGRWRRAHEDLPIHLQPSLRFLDVANGEADVGIRCGRPPWPGLKAELVCQIHMSPVCSPSLLGERRALREPLDSLAFTMIHADIAGHELGEEWKTWLAAAGHPEVGKLDGLSFHDPNLALQAAVDGLGIAIGYRELAEHDIATGRLIYPFELMVRHAFSYYLVYPSGRALKPKVRRFRKWVLAES